MPEPEPPIDYKRDLYVRLTSRKFLLTLVTALIQLFLYATGAIDAVAFAAALTASVGAYAVAEGVADGGRGR
jgi:hypothetical protein